MQELMFDEKEHRYWIGEEEIPSVTSVIRFVNVDIAFQANTHLRDMAADRGTRVHEACAAYDYTHETNDVDPDILGYVAAYMDFLHDYGIKDWELIESPFAKWTTIAGTIDRYGTVLGKKTLFDIKTSSKLNMKAYSLQLEAYRELLEYNDYKVEQMGIIHLKKDGGYSVRFVEPGIPEIKTALLCCQILNDYLRRKEKKVGKRSEEDSAD